MTTQETIITEFDFSDPTHQKALAYLMNGYIADDMGGGVLLTSEQQATVIEWLKNHSQTVAYLALTNDMPSGLIIGYQNLSTFTAKPMINIHDVFVDNRFRGLGIGRMLMEKLTEYAKLQGCSRITLEVRHDNITAQNLYKSLGFEDTEPPMYFWRMHL